jgi:hypothetical protein
MTSYLVKLRGKFTLPQPMKILLPLLLFLIYSMTLYQLLVE